MKSNHKITVRNTLTIDERLNELQDLALKISIETENLRKMKTKRNNLALSLIKDNEGPLSIRFVAKIAGVSNPILVRLLQKEKHVGN